MTKQSNTKTASHAAISSTKPSALSQFHLAFELDKTWNQAKQTVQHRPSKK